MKYVLIILAGAADEPIDALKGHTPLEHASLPALRRLSERGRVGCAVTIPEDVPPGSEAGVLSLLGYDPRRNRAGRAALEAAALGVELREGEWTLRLSLVTVGAGDESGLVVDAAPAGLSEREAGVLAVDLMRHWQGACPELVKGMELGASVGSRHLVVDRSGVSYEGVRTVPPAAAVGREFGEQLPEGGRGGERLRGLVESSAEFLSAHEVNAARVEQGLRPANLAWLWGQGAPMRLPSFEGRYRVRGALFVGDDAIGGIAAAAGMDRLPVFCGLAGEDPLGLVALCEGVTDALRRCDLVCCYVDDALRESARGDVMGKVAVLEAIDRQLVGPLVAALEEQYGDPAVDVEAEGWRVMVTCDCVASTARRELLSDPVPLVMGGAWVRSAVARGFMEREAGESDLCVDPGTDLMEYFLRGGLASVRAR